MDAIGGLLDEIYRQREQLEAAVKKDANIPGFDLRPTISDVGPTQTLAGFRKSLTTHQLVSELMGRVEAVQAAALSGLGDKLPIALSAITELRRAHEALIAAAVGASNDGGNFIDAEILAEHHARFLELNRLRPVLQSETIQSLGRQSDATALGKNELAVLMLLNNRYPALCTLDDITNVSRKTASKTIQWLIEAGYAHRPNGERGGATITDAGKSVAKALAQITH